jgi:ABC-type glycerol-3-phosphate transport system permease component
VARTKCALSAAAVIILPVLALALCVQRYIVRGRVSGAVTG